jgi:hypothetical protein
MPDQILNSNNYQIKYPHENPDITKIKNQKIIFSLAAFNVDMLKLKKRVQYLSEGFKEVHIFIYSLDSTDENTLKELQIWKSENNNVHLVEPINLKGKPRILRIGGIRNEILKQAKLKIKDENYLYITLDADHKGPMSKSGLIDAIERLNSQKEVYAICASGTNTIYTGLSFLYDTFAYINKNNIPGFKLKLHSTLNKYNQIISGFSGAAVYRYTDLIDIEYNLKSDECEHVSLHKTLKEKYDKKYKKECFMEMSKNMHIYIGLQKSNL